ncbi:MAG: LptE family protein [Candidatus Omnitrophota bacterium]
MKKLSALLFVCMLPALSSGCGYSTHSLAYSKSTTIYIRPFENKVDLNIGTDLSDKNPYRLYRPGMEVKITNAVINRFQIDGYLKVVSREDDADLVLNGSLINYEKQPLRYDQLSENVEEYRANIIVDISLEDVMNSKTVWAEKGFVGYKEYALTGPKAQSEESAVNEAVEDLARRVVERTVEDW